MQRESNKSGVWMRHIIAKNGLYKPLTRKDQTSKLCARSECASKLHLCRLGEVCWPHCSLVEGEEFQSRCRVAGDLSQRGVGGFLNFLVAALQNSQLPLASLQQLLGSSIKTQSMESSIDSIRTILGKPEQCQDGDMICSASRSEK